jgi:hypothetical protein
MVPASFANFFLATAGAGGALIGLLFVAVSLNPERVFSEGAPRERRAVTSGAFTALVNAFFISTAALIPGINLGYVAAIMAVLGLLNSVRVGMDLLRYQLRRRRGPRDLALRIARAAVVTVFSFAIYSFELSNAWDLLHNPGTTGDLDALCALILAIYGVGLTRAWQLLGGPHSGFLPFLNPLAGLQDDRSDAASTEEAERGAAERDAAHSGSGHHH